MADANAAVGVVVCGLRGAQRVNYALPADAARGLLADGQHRMGDEELARFLGTAPAEEDDSAPPILVKNDIEEMALRIAQEVLEKGYVPCKGKGTSVLLALDANTRHELAFEVKAGPKYAVLAFGLSLRKLDITVLGPGGSELTKVEPEPYRLDVFTEFRPPAAGRCRISVKNEARHPAQVWLIVFEEELLEGRPAQKAEGQSSVP